MNQHSRKVCRLIVAILLAIIFWCLQIEELNGRWSFSSLANASTNIASPSFEVGKLGVELFNKHIYETNKNYYRTEVYNINQDYYFKDKELEQFKNNGIDYESESPLSYYGQGVLKMRGEDYQGAIADYSDSLRRGSFAEAYLGRGQAYVKIASSLVSNNPEKAQRFFRLCR